MVGTWSRLGYCAPGHLLVEDLGVLGGQALAAVLDRHDDPGQTAVEEQALELALVCDVGQLFFVGLLAQHSCPTGGKGNVLLDVGAGPRPEALQAFHLGAVMQGHRLGAHAASPFELFRASKYIGEAEPVISDGAVQTASRVTRRR